MTQKKVNKSLAKPLALTAGILGLVQGIVWFIFSVLSICCYFNAITLDGPALGTNSTNLDYYQYIYEVFLKNEGFVRREEGMLIDPNDFSIFMWFYIVFSAIWTIVSGAVIWAMINEKWSSTKYLFGGWSAITILTSIVDIILTSLLANDFYFLTNSEYFTTYGIVMSLAARGYILWVVNVIFACILIKFTIDVVKNENSQSRMPIIHGYETTDGVMNPPWSNGPSELWAGSEPPTPKIFDGYQNHGFERSQSFFPAAMSDYRNPYQESYSNNSTLPNNNSHEQSRQRFFPNTTSDNRNAFTDSYSNSRFPDNDPPEQQSQNFFPDGAPENRNMYGDPYSNARAPQQPTNETQSSFAQSIANKFATIGKKIRGAPVNNVAPPMIPEPDYTPPGSPTGLKSVLRSRSNYQ